MSERLARRSTQRGEKETSFLRRQWWLLAIALLVVLVAIIYLLSHLSAADSEMYPTTMLRQQLAHLRVC